MMNESAGTMKKVMRPVLPIKDFEDVLVQLKPDPNCRQCYGRGYLSFTANPQGGTTMNLCPCATFGETEILKVLRATGLVMGAVNGLASAVSEALARIEKNQKEQGEAVTISLQRIEERLNRPNIIVRALRWIGKRIKKGHLAVEPERKDESCPVK